MSLTLSFKTVNSTLQTKAVVTPQEEDHIENIYILIFNPNGTIAYRNFFDGLNSVGSHTLTLQNVYSGTKQSVHWQILTTLLCVLPMRN